MQRSRSFSLGQISSCVQVVGRDNLFDRLEKPVYFIADTNTERYVPPGGPMAILPPGERSKVWTKLETLLRQMLQSDLTRDATVVGVGGGVICDIAACAASLYMRGCDLVLLPTTLLAMADAALGGKTGINFDGFKNMIGTFYPAREIRLCPDLLLTLPDREYLSGLAEVIKTAMLGDPALLDILESDTERINERNQELLAEVVWRCVAVKGRIVEVDLREHGQRAHLNLGHTFAHALESEEGLGSWTHGEAVAWGIMRAMETGVATGVTNPDYARRIARLLALYGYRTDPIPEAAGRLLEAMQKDKKRRSESGYLILQEDVTSTIIRPLDEGVVREVLTGNGPDLRQADAHA